MAGFCPSKALACGVLGVVLASGCRDPQAGAATPAPTPSSLTDEPPPSAPPPATSATPPAAFVPEKVTGEDKAMGTHLTYAAFTTPEVGPAEVRSAFQRATAEIARLEALMTTWRPDSDLSRVNEAAGKSAVVVDPETFAVVEESVKTSRLSEGTFDITFESLHGVWKFDQDWDPHPPDPQQVKARLPLVGYRHIQLEPATRAVRLDRAGVKISLGGIAKGYAVDKAAKVLDEAHLTSFYVQAGGDLFARGTKPDGSAWQAGIRDPRGPEGSFFAILELSDHAFSTAGDYERAYVVGGKRYHHIIDPRTGYPATASRSVTVWAPTAFVADALDDAIFILGPEKGLKLVEATDGAGAVVVDARNNLWVSKRLQGKLRVTRPPSDGT